MHLDHLLESREHEIGRSGQIVAVQPETVAEPMRGPPNSDLGLGASLANTAHVRATRLG